MTGSFVPHIPFGLDPIWVSVTVLAVTYAFIIAGRHNRAVVALIGAVVLILVGALDQGEAIKGIDWDTIGLLTGMMILVAISRRSGLFQYLAVWSAQRVKAHPAGILLMLQIATALLSTVLNNVSTVLLIVPVTLVIAEELEVTPFPFLFAEVFASNIGGTATLIGDPPNILIGTQAGLDFNDFIANIAPVTAVLYRRTGGDGALHLGPFAPCKPREPRAGHGYECARTDHRLGAAAPLGGGHYSCIYRIRAGAAAAAAAGNDCARRRCGTHAAGQLEASRRHAGGQCAQHLRGDRVGDDLLFHRPVRRGSRG